MKIILALLTVSILMFSFSASAKNPDCTGADRWPASVAFVKLKNAEIIDSHTLDDDKTKVVRLASEKIGKDLYRQVHRVTFVKKSGETVAAIVLNDASHEECSVDGGDVYVISKHLGVVPEQK